MKVLTFGVYDYLHYGHLKLFERASKLGDYLIVAVQKDEEIHKTKQEANMLYNLEQRMEFVGAIKFVNEVVPYTQVDEDIKKIDFDVFVLGEEAELVIKRGQIVDKIKQLEDISESVLHKLTKCVDKVFSLLWKRGMEEIFLMEKTGEIIVQALKEAKVIEYVYSEYMMKRQFFAEDSLEEDIVALEVREDEGSLVYENKEKSFFCRLLPYQEENSFYLYEVEVAENLRNQGIATKCLQQLGSDLVKKSEGREVTISLQVGSYNEPALYLYQKLGFELSEEICYNTMQ